MLSVITLGKVGIFEMAIGPKGDKEKKEMKQAREDITWQLSSMSFQSPFKAMINYMNLFLLNKLEKNPVSLELLLVTTDMFLKLYLFS